MSKPDLQTVDVEVHVTGDTVTHRQVQGAAERSHPGYRVTGVRSTDRRCRHGHRLWEVDLDEDRGGWSEGELREAYGK